MHRAALRKILQRPKILSPAKPRQLTVVATDRMYLNAVAVPPTEASTSLGARVEHILVNEPGSLSEVVASALNLPQVGSYSVCCVSMS
jgi:hypothetical protein